MQILTFPLLGKQLLSYSMPCNFWDRRLMINQKKEINLDTLLTSKWHFVENNVTLHHYTQDLI